MAYDLATLSEAVVHGNVDLIRDYLAHGGNPSRAEKSTGISLLQEAADTKQLEIVKLLIEAGANVNTHDIYQDSPLSLALQYPSEDELSMVTPDGFVTQEAHPVSHDPEVQLQIVRLLLDAGAKVDPRKATRHVTRGAYYGFKPPLSHAVEAGSMALVELLLERGADVNATDYFLWTPLMEAASAGHIEIARRLLAAGADVHARDENEHTALQIARGRGHEELADLLAKAGGSPSSTEGI